MARAPSPWKPYIKPDSDDNCFIQILGFPWSVTTDDIQSFLGDCQIRDGKNGIHLILSPFGRPSGEAFVELATPEDALRALKKNRELIGHKYIEVYSATRRKLDWVVSLSNVNMDSIKNEACIRIRGLPFGCTKETVKSFFSGLLIVPDGIYFATDHHGKATGEAYVQFVNKECVEKALQKHKEKIGHRCIEIFRSSSAEIEAQKRLKMRTSVAGSDRLAPYNPSERIGGPNRFRGVDGGPHSRFAPFRNDNVLEDKNNSDPWGHDDGDRFAPRSKPPMRGAGRPHFVHMRGIPLAATEKDIAAFFSPLRTVDIKLIYDGAYKATGLASVTFASHDEAVRAMYKHMQYIGNRYIPLRLDSVADSNNFSEMIDRVGRFLFSPESAVGEFGGGKMVQKVIGRGRGFGYINRDEEDLSHLLPCSPETTMAEFGGGKMGNVAEGRGRGFGYYNRAEEDLSHLPPYPPETTTAEFGGGKMGNRAGGHGRGFGHDNHAEEELSHLLPYSPETTTAELGGGKMGNVAEDRGRGFDCINRDEEDLSHLLPCSPETTMAKFGGGKMGNVAEGRGRGFGYYNRAEEDLSHLPPYPPEATTAEFGGGKMGNVAGDRGRGFDCINRDEEDLSHLLPCSPETTMAEFGGGKMGNRAGGHGRGFGHDNHAEEDLSHLLPYSPETTTAELGGGKMGYRAGGHGQGFGHDNHAEEDLSHLLPCSPDLSTA